MFRVLTAAGVMFLELAEKAEIDPREFLEEAAKLGS